ncbi:hypothetical protein BET10_14605 [Pseudoalteromonas amylolytica]|uniref:Uncharacterized protein n=1 Tax=Pseudoalteromonas amylolytica TaxID=1859457 RepID=A0A1S1MTF4_9GAMM|nr:hypothetical protein BFC16_20370 [Pseudoalteromonas sp. JW3]OHU90008.1 hypothetical protein BET10_14605 [Pseudoalteromonas amylolytica]
MPLVSLFALIAKLAAQCLCALSEFLLRFYKCKSISYANDNGYQNQACVAILALLGQALRILTKRLDKYRCDIEVIFSCLSEQGMWPSGSP